MGVGVLSLGYPGTFSVEWMSRRWGVQGPFQGRGCPGAGVSRDLSRVAGCSKAKELGELVS
jgi:hypothetical protein